MLVWLKEGLRKFMAHKQEPSTAMSMAELEGISINGKVAEIAYAHAERRLIDLLDSKAAFENKAAILVGAYTTLTLALFGGAWTLFEKPGFNGVAGGMLLCGVDFAIGAFCFAMAFRQKEYGLLGVDPELWLRSGVIDGADSVVGDNLAYIARFYEARIAISLKSNMSKAWWIELGIWLSVASPLAFIYPVICVHRLCRPYHLYLS
ncbi:MAG: hypothetical protein WDM89_22685 [Rhizomicrobium sp.]